MFNYPPYMGRTTGEVGVFLKNFALNLSQFATQLGIPPAQVTYLKDGAALYNWYEGTYLGEIRNASLAATDGRDMLAADKVPSPFTPVVAQFTPPPTTATPINDGFVGYVDTLVKQIRLNAAYKTNPNIGTVLKINNTPAPIVPPAKASIRGLEAQANFAMQVKANKYGAKSVLFYDMNDPANPALLSAQSSATLVDNRPPSVPGQSEMRAYAVRYGDSQNKPLPNSLMSDVVSLPTHP